MGELRSSTEKAERKAAQERVAAHHDQELRGLVDHLRSALAQLDAGEIDVFEFDAIVHRYKKAAQKLWSYCSVDGVRLLPAARAIEAGESPDWWVLAAPRRH